VSFHLFYENECPPISKGMLIFKKNAGILIKVNTSADQNIEVLHYQDTWPLKSCEPLKQATSRNKLPEVPIAREHYVPC
jgi:hypothetical protein